MTGRRSDWAQPRRRPRLQGRLSDATSRLLRRAHAAPSSTTTYHAAAPLAQTAAAHTVTAARPALTPTPISALTFAAAALATPQNLRAAMRRHGEDLPQEGR